MTAFSTIHGRIRPNFKHIRDYTPIAAVFLTYKNEEDPIKNEGARVVTSLYAPSSILEPLWLSLLPTRMKKIQSKIKALKAWSHRGTDMQRRANGQKSAEFGYPVTKFIPSVARCCRDRYVGHRSQAMTA